MHVVRSHNYKLDNQTDHTDTFLLLSRKSFFQKLATGSIMIKNVRAIHCCCCWLFFNFVHMSLLGLWQTFLFSAAVTFFKNTFFRVNFLKNFFYSNNEKWELIKAEIEAKTGSVCKSDFELQQKYTRFGLGVSF